MIARVSPTGGAQASWQEATTTRQHGGWRRGRGFSGLTCVVVLPAGRAIAWCPTPSLEGKGERERERQASREVGR